MTPSSARRVAALAAILFSLAPLATAERYILRTAPGADVASIDAAYGLALVHPLDRPGGQVYLVTGSDPAPAGLANAVLADPRVLGFEGDAQVQDTDIDPPAPSGPPANASALSAAVQDLSSMSYFGATVRSAFVRQWAASLIHMPDVLQRYAPGSGTVAVIDTGVDPDHPALKGVLVPGYDFTRDQAGYASEMGDLNQSTVALLDQSTVALLDGTQSAVVLNQSTVALLDQSTVALLDANQIPTDFGHGTMVSGLIHLVAPAARIMPLKAFRADGSADLADIVRAIYYAVDNHADVINMSFSSSLSSPSLTAAVQYAISHNVVCIAAGGNEGGEVVVYPAAVRGVNGVGSTGASDQHSLFSNYDTASVRMVAPGEALITAYPGNHYAGVWGTSFSAALTSGAAAILHQFRREFDPEKVNAALSHGPKLQIDGKNVARLDILAAVLYYLLDD